MLYPHLSCGSFLPPHRKALNDSFSKETEEKLQVKIVQSEERLREQRQKQMEQIQTRRNEVQVIILIPSINEMHFHFFFSWKRRRRFGRRCRLLHHYRLVRSSTPRWRLTRRTAKHTSMEKWRNRLNMWVHDNSDTPCSPVTSLAMYIMLICDIIVFYLFRIDTCGRQWRRGRRLWKRKVVAWRRRSCAIWRRRSRTATKCCKSAPTRVATTYVIRSNMIS